MFSASEDDSGGLGGAKRSLGLFRRAHTESISIVAPEAWARVDLLDSSL